MKRNEPTQLERVYELMRDGKWRTLREIHRALGKGLDTSISARLRDLRKPFCGCRRVECRGRNHIRGLYEYRLTPTHATLIDNMLEPHPMLGDIHPYMTGPEPRVAPKGGKP